MQPFVPDQEKRYSSSLSKSRIFHRTFWIIEPKSIKHLRPILNWFRRFSSTGVALTIKRTLLRIVRFWDFRKKVLEVRIQLFTMEIFQNIKLEFAELNWTLYINLQHMQWVLQRPNWRYIIPLANSLTSSIPWCDWLLPTYTFYAPRRKPISTTGAIHSQRLRKVSYFISVVSLFGTLVTHLLLKHF